MLEMIGLVIKLILLITAITVYFLPTIITAQRYKINDYSYSKQRCITFNDILWQIGMDVFMNWTIIGWFVGVSLSQKDPSHKRYEERLSRKKKKQD